MSGIYFYADTRESAAGLAGFAQATGKISTLIVAKANAAAMKNLGFDRIVEIDVPVTDLSFCGKGISEYLVAENSELFAAASTTRGRELAANIAGYLDCPMVSDATSAEFKENGLRTTKIVYGGAVNVTEIIHGMGVVTIPIASFEPGVSKDAEESTLNLSSAMGITIESESPIVHQGTDLSKADRVVCAGLGIDKREDMELIKELADALDAEVGCTRSVAEARKWLPVEQYIGMTGVVIKPSLYLGVGVSGQIQHIFGVKDAKIIVGIDKNENVPMFHSCDYGIVGDLYEAVPLLIAAIKK